MEHKPVEKFIRIDPVSNFDQNKPIYIPDLDPTPAVHIELSNEEQISFIKNGMLDMAATMQRFSLAVDYSKVESNVSTKEIPSMLADAVEVLDPNIVPEKFETLEDLSLAAELTIAKASAVAEESSNPYLVEKLKTFVKDTSEQAAGIISRHWKKGVSGVLALKLATACVGTEGLPQTVKPEPEATKSDPTEVAPLPPATTTTEAEVEKIDIQVKDLTDQYKSEYLNQYLPKHPEVTADDISVHVFGFEGEGGTDLGVWVINKETGTTDNVSLFDPQMNVWLDHFPVINEDGIDPTLKMQIMWSPVNPDGSLLPTTFIIDVPKDPQSQDGSITFIPLPTSKNGAVGPSKLPNRPGSPLNELFKSTSYNPTQEAPQTNEGQKIVEVVEESRDAINEFQAKIVWGINKDNEHYWDQIGVTSEQGLIDYLKENSWMLPASTDGSKTKLLYFSVGGNNEHHPRPLITMDKPLLIAPEMVFFGPDTKEADLPRTGLVEYGISTNVSTDPGERSASAGTIVKDAGTMNTLQHIIYWKDPAYDLFGNKYDGNVQTIKTQADQLSRLMFNFFLAYSIYDDDKTTVAGELAKQYNNWAPLDNNGIDSAFLSTFFTGLRGKFELIPTSDLPPTIYK